MPDRPSRAPALGTAPHRRTHPEFRSQIDRVDTSPAQLSAERYLLAPGRHRAEGGVF